MYLTSSELNKIAGSVITGCDHPNHPFDPAEQIKVCSFDLRVGNIFWVSKRGKRSLDLGAHFIFEVSPRRLWQQHVIEDGGCIPLKPGEMILGQTYEKVSIPKNLVGKINTRSSYARLGISTACNCDLVNPGYVGHIPLELTNTTRNTFLIRPYLSLCQMFLMPLQGEADDSYDDEKFHSKYMNDDGGPSVWWRDNLAKKISRNTIQSQISDNVVHALSDKFKSISDSGLYRLEKFIEGKTFANSTDLMARFGDSERKKSRWYKIRKSISLWSVTLAVPSVMQVQQKLLTPGQSPDLVSWFFWGATLVAAPFFLFYALSPKKEFYGDLE